MLPEGNRLQRDDNRIALVGGVSYLNNQALVQGTFDPTTGGQLVYLVNGGGGTLPSGVVAGQQAVTATAAALPAATLTQGVIITGLSTNSISVFIGGSGVTDSTGAELQPGAALSVAVANLDAVYVIASTTGASVTWIGS